MVDVVVPRLDGFELLRRIRELGYVRLVRRKIEENPRMPRYLVSRRGLGYALVSNPGTDTWFYPVSRTMLPARAPARTIAAVM